MSTNRRLVREVYFALNAEGLLPGEEWFDIRMNSLVSARKGKQGKIHKAGTRNKRNALEIQRFQRGS